MRLRVYYDGLCHLCSREIEHYRRLPVSEPIDFVDIMDPQFDPVAESLEPEEIRRQLHSRDESGRLFVGVATFLEIWKRIPRYRGLYLLARLPVAHQLLEAFYFLFVRIRPWLPRKQGACANGHCEITTRKT